MELMRLQKDDCRAILGLRLGAAGKSTSMSWSPDGCFLAIGKSGGRGVFIIDLEDILQHVAGSDHKT